GRGGGGRPRRGAGGAALAAPPPRARTGARERPAADARSGRRGLIDLLGVCAFQRKPTMPFARRPSWPPRTRARARARSSPGPQHTRLQSLEHTLLELKHAGIGRARRGAKGGYWLARPANEVTIAEVVRTVEGPIAHVQSSPPEAIEYRGNAEHLREVWIAVR